MLAVTGRPPESFEAITRRYAALPQMRRTPGNFMRTFAGFMSGPMRPGINPRRRFADALRMPTLQRPSFSAGSALWREEHGVTADAGSAPARTSTVRPAPGEAIAQRA